MEFDPNNPVIKRCIQGMQAEEKGNVEEARELFLEAWAEAENHFEKFTAAFYIARTQRKVPNRLEWLITAVNHASQVQSDTVKSALSSLYSDIATCYKAMDDLKQADKYHTLARRFKDKVFDSGPFYHGTKADLGPGDLLRAGGGSNYQSGLVMNHIYFTSLIQGAALAAALAKGDGPDRVYQVEPTGDFENDPNVTDKKFPGNPSRSYRSTAPLNIIEEVTGWTRLAPEEVQKWKEKIAQSDGEIIN